MNSHHTVEELAQLSGDLQNFLAATQIATLFLDRELRIMRFTPQVQELFDVRLADRGRPLSDLPHLLSYDEILDDAAAVLERLVTTRCPNGWRSSPPRASTRSSYSTSPRWSWAAPPSAGGHRSPGNG